LLPGLIDPNQSPKHCKFVASKVTSSKQHPAFPPQHANNPTDAKVWSRILEMEASGEEVMWPDSRTAQRLMDGGLYAAITDNVVAQELLQNNCKLVVAPHRFLANNIPMYLQKHSAYTRMVGGV
jgi:hypothetical protein